MNKLTDFAKGIIAGVIASMIIFGVVAGIYFHTNHNKELIEYAERQIEIEALREDYSNRDPVEFLDDIPGVRGASDGVAADFDTRLTEILHRFRNRLIDR
jgi:hypothetical protein